MTTTGVRSGTGEFPQVGADERLCQHAVQVYAGMAGGLVIMGVATHLAGAMPADCQPVPLSPLQWAIIFAPPLFVLLLSLSIGSMPAGLVELLFCSFCAALVLPLSSLFPILMRR